MVRTARDQPRRLTRDLVFFMDNHHLYLHETPNNLMFDDIRGLLGQKFGGHMVRSQLGAIFFWFCQPKSKLVWTARNACGASRRGLVFFQRFTHPNITQKWNNIKFGDIPGLLGTREFSPSDQPRRFFDFVQWTSKSIFHQILNYDDVPPRWGHIKVDLGLMRHFVQQPLKWKNINRNGPVLGQDEFLDSGGLEEVRLHKEVHINW